MATVSLVQVNWQSCTTGSYITIVLDHDRRTRLLVPRLRRLSTLHGNHAGNRESESNDAAIPITVVPASVPSPGGGNLRQCTAGPGFLESASQLQALGREVNGNSHRMFCCLYLDSSHKYSPHGVNCETFYAYVRLS